MAIAFKDKVARAMQKQFDKGKLSKGFKIGIFTRKVVKYGMVQEAEHHYMRDAAISASDQQKHLMTLWNTRIISGKQWFDVALKSAIAHAELIKKNLETIPLRKTGALIKSINVKRANPGRKRGRKRRR
jgi:hypothetical protein